jgi:hypothetical protein
MYLLYTDEVNTEPSKDFFVYAGVSIPGENAGIISQEIDRLRLEYGYRPKDILKFNTVERPTYISPEQHRNIKKEVIEIVGKHKVKLFSSFILHKISTSPEDARLKEINRVCYHFDCFLNHKKSKGLVLIDPFQDRRLRDHLCEKFSIGIMGLPYTPVSRLQNILGFHIAYIGTSNFCSLVDIVLGSLRYAVNNRENKTTKGVAKTLISQLEPLCIREEISKKVSELSIFFSPKIIKEPSYRLEYIKLHAFLKEGGIEPSQYPSDTRSY